MKNLKFVAILAFLMPAFFAINSCNVIKCDNAYPYFSLRYNGQYTGIDTLINVDGYYTSIIGVTPSLESFSFYRDGSLFGYFSSNKIYYYGLNDQIFEKLELGLMTDSIKTWSIGFGLYKISNDTIKLQLYKNYGMGNKIYHEVWFKILSREKLLVIKYKGIDRFCDYCTEYLNQELVFYPAWRPDSTDNWLRDCLREKGVRK